MSFTESYTASNQAQNAVSGYKKVKLIDQSKINDIYKKKMTLSIVWMQKLQTEVLDDVEENAQIMMSSR